MAYGIMRVEKRHMGAVTGLQLEANRTPDDRDKRHFDNSEIDWNKTGENVSLIHCDHWQPEIRRICDEAGVRIRKDSDVLLDGFYGISGEYAASHSREEMMDYFRDCLKFHEEHYGHVINAVVHWDETTPHMQVASVPIHTDENGKNHLSAKIIMGNRGDYIRRQDEFYDEICKDRGLDRGERAAKTKRKHETALDHKIAQTEQEHETLQDQNTDLHEELLHLEQDPKYGAELQIRAVKQVMQEHSVRSGDKSISVYDWLQKDINKLTMDPLWRAEQLRQLQQEHGRLPEEVRHQHRDDPER